MPRQEKKLNAQYLSDRLILVSLIAGFLLNIILWIVLAGKFGWQKGSVPLHFNSVYGIDFVSKARYVYELPAAGLLIFLVNLFLGHAMFYRERIFSYFLTFSSVFVQILLLASAMALVFSNV